ncbi:hypothetical protein L6R29_24435 [Myxococcota bacterium]|nr:hypothetical protein [Myxococcota bacterium]
MRVIRFLLFVGVCGVLFSCGPKQIEMVPDANCQAAFQALSTKTRKGCMIFRQKSELIWIFEYKERRFWFCLDETTCASEDIQMPPPADAQEEATLLFPPSELAPSTASRREVSGVCNSFLNHQSRPTCWNEANTPPDPQRCWTFLQIKTDLMRTQARCSAISTSP